MALRLLAGLLQGSGTALLVDRRKGLIWNEAVAYNGWLTKIQIP